MTRRKAATEPSEVELDLWTRRFSAMVDSGVSLMCCLQVLAEEPTSGPLRQITREVAAKVEHGQTLSEAFNAWPTVFDESYVAEIVTGEVGGILDVTMRRACERRGVRTAASPRGVKDQLTRQDLADWCWRFGHMLTAGVDLLFALDTLSKLGPPLLQDISRECHGEVRVGLSLAPADHASSDQNIALWRYPGVFSQTTLQLIAVGVWHGPLDKMLQEAAALLDYEADLEAAGKLPPLALESVKRERGTQAKKPGVEHPVIKRVNEIFIAALCLQAEGIQFSPTEADKGEARIFKDGVPADTMPVENYQQAVRRVKIMAGLDPFAQTEGQGTIYVDYQGRESRFHVRASATPLAPLGGCLWLSFEKDSKTVELQ
jgi:hypothetical protein